ncbi:MAG TPA: type II toxin-antitoxin system VapC family toxin [Beijerinckiaceae bacterium]|jgi:predicted nucleic acid-binding protein
MADRGQPLIYFDANPFMYAFESGPELAEPVLALIRALESKPGLGVTSELVLGELLAPTRKPNAIPTWRKRRIYLSLLVFNTFFDLRPVTREVIIETATLREHANLKLVDAIHMVTAIHAGCRYFLSNDRDMERRPEGMRIVQPDASGVELLLRELA